MEELPEYRVLIESGVHATGHEGIRHIRVDVYVTIPGGDDENDEDYHAGVCGTVELSSDCQWTDDWYTVDWLEGLRPVHPEAYFFALGLLQAAQGLACIWKDNLDSYRPLNIGNKPVIALGGKHPHAEYAS